MRLATPRRELRPQAALAAVLGSLMVDNDAWLFLIDPAWYGYYHRIVTHSVVGMAALTIVNGLLAYGVLSWARARRFGWFVNENLPGASPPRAPLIFLIGIAGMAVMLHWCADAVTAFGNMEPLWPWVRKDVSLGWVNSIDIVVMGLTVVWHLATRELEWPRRKEIMLGLYWLLAVGAYIVMKNWMGFRAYI